MSLIDQLVDEMKDIHTMKFKKCIGWIDSRIEKPNPENDIRFLCRWETIDLTRYEIFYYSKPTGCYYSISRIYENLVDIEKKNGKYDWVPLTVLN